MRIFIFRHGETLWNLTGQHTSYTDLPLNEKGVEEAKALKKNIGKISFTYVFASPMMRAIDTCVHAGLGKEMIIREDLSEWNYGKYEGKTTAEIRQKEASWTIFSHGALGGESLYDIEHRGQKLLSELRELKGDIALFSHGHFSRVLGALWIGLPAKAGAHFSLSNGTISLLGYERDHPAILCWNATKYKE